MTIEDLILVCVERNPREEDVHSLVTAIGGDVDHALGLVALDVARRYMAGALALGVCDAIMNAVFAYATGVLRRFPEPMYSVFLAFDEGEYHHSGDHAGIIPEQKYTRSQLAEILRGEDAA